MLLKFKVQRQPIIPASSWDKNQIMQHTAIRCCSLLSISFYWRGKKRTNSQQGNQNLFSNPACPLAFNTSSSASNKETAGKLCAEFPKLKTNKKEIWKQNHPLGCRTCSGTNTSAQESCRPAAWHILEQSTNHAHPRGWGAVMQMKNSPRESAARHGLYIQKYLPLKNTHLQHCPKSKRFGHLKSQICMLSYTSNLLRPQIRLHVYRSC